MAWWQAAEEEGGQEGQNEETRARLEKARAAEEQRKRMQDANAALAMGLGKKQKGPAWLTGGAGGKPKKAPRAKKKAGDESSLMTCSNHQRPVDIPETQYV